MALFCVEPESRGNGIGKDLMLEAEGQAKSAGAGKMSLNVRDDNPGGIRLCTKLGYSQARRKYIDMPELFSGAIIHMPRLI